MVDLMISQIAVNEQLLMTNDIDYMFSVEEVKPASTNRYNSFPRCYKQVGLKSAAGNSMGTSTTHEGSIGNPVTTASRNS